MYFSVFLRLKYSLISFVSEILQWVIIIKNMCIMQLSVSIIYARICSHINDDVRMGISLTYPTMTARSRGRLHSSLTWGATAPILRTPRTWALNHALLRSITHTGHMTSSKSQLMDTWSQQEVDMLTRYTIHLSV